MKRFGMKGFVDLTTVEKNTAADYFYSQGSPVPIHMPPRRLLLRVSHCAGPWPSLWARFIYITRMARGDSSEQGLGNQASVLQMSLLRSGEARRLTRQEANQQPRLPQSQCSSIAHPAPCSRRQGPHPPNRRWRGRCPYSNHCSSQKSFLFPPPFSFFGQENPKRPP